MTSPPAVKQRHCALIDSQFDWRTDRPLNIPLSETIIYELHVRGFTRHPSSGVSKPGTFAGLIEKIPYLQSLGVTAVELMPIYDFEEDENPRVNPLTGEKLFDYWGYNPISFFAPNTAYSSDLSDVGPVDEFKQLVKSMHAAGIEVILDVVFNHTAEGGETGQTFEFRGLDNSVYYMIHPGTGEYLNYSGCGNTLNCNHPVVRDLVVQALRYWVVEMHVDGFPLRSGLHPRPRPGWLRASEPTAHRASGDGSGAGGHQTDCRSVGRRRTLPGRLLSVLGPLGRMERQVSRRRAPVPEGRSGNGVRAGNPSKRKPGSLFGQLARALA